MRIYIHVVIIFVLVEFYTREVKTVIIQPYVGYKVLNVLPQTKEQLQYLQLLANSTQGLENISVPLDVSPSGIESLSDLLQQKDIPFWVAIDDLQEQINREREENLSPVQTNYADMGPEKFVHDRYHTLEEIDLYLESVKSLREDLVQIKTFGRTIEGRSLKYIQIQKNSESNKPIILIEAGTHAREWISPATSLYLISKFIAENKNREEALMLDNFDWIIIPLLNPDGYVYTWTEDRLWRKNRRAFPSRRQQVNNHCNGVDLNRNFDVGYTDKTYEARYFFCTEVFAGSEPFSEPETRALRDLVNPIKSRIKMFISLHSFSQVWVTPFVYKHEFPPNYGKMGEMLRKACEAMEVLNGNVYDYGAGSFRMYPAKGTSADWIYEKANISYSFILELPDRGEFGFLLPKDQIIPIGQEVWRALNILSKELS